jgi:GH15 family glucan-1,4-alpha-glucosidase
MAWVAVDRAVKALEDFGFEGDLARWKSLRNAIHEDVCNQGFNKEVGAFTQAYGSKHLDASVLMAPLVGFLPITDERIISTVNLINKELVVEGFVLRYRTDNEGVDGLPAGEGVFLPCSFWLVDCLYLMGRKEEAHDLFDRLLKLSTRLGLISEEYDVRNKRLVGNFPQAFTHVGLINTAMNLSPRPGPADYRSSK